MEIENNVEVSPPLEKDRSPENEQKSRDIWVIILNIFLALVTLLLLAYVAYKNGYIDLDNIFNVSKNAQEENEEDIDEQEIEEDIEVLTVTYEGDVLSAMLPSGWDIVEYLDGDGSDMLVSDVNYSGLTGLKVLNGNKEILTMGAVSGIGFIGCAELALFDDSSNAYLQEMMEINEEVGMEMNTIDYTDQEYTDFSWFGKVFRLVNRSFYFDSVSGNTTFEPQCEKGLITVPGFSFEDGDGYESTAYYYEIGDSATNNELNMLVLILASME